jgi:hypothetical protein
MTKSDQNKLRFLIILVVILAATVYVGFRVSRTPDLTVVQAKDQKPMPAAATPNDARIQLELLDKARANEDLGKSNLFAYRNGRPPEPTKVAPPPPPSMVNNNPAATRPTVVMPPPPPPIPLKYVGYAYVEPNSKVLIATLLDDNQQRHFNAVQGDIWMGRYRVLRITDTVVDVEDIETSRRQTLALVK